MLDYCELSVNLPVSKDEKECVWKEGRAEREEKEEEETNI